MDSMVANCFMRACFWKWRRDLRPWRVPLIDNAWKSSKGKPKILSIHFGDPMRVIFIQKTTGRGGAKKSLAETLVAMRGGGLKPRVIVGERGPFVETCTALDVRCDIVRLPEWRKFFERIRFAGAMRTAAELVRESNPDWVISNEMWWGPHAARIARHLGCRSAVILRDGIADIPKARRYRLFDNDLILSVSSAIADGLATDPALAARTHVLFNSVRLPEPGGLGTQLEIRLAAFPRVRRWLLVVGRVCRRKRQADAIHVLRRLIDDGEDDLGLLLAGDVDADYEETLRTTITGTEVSDRVLCLGNFEDLRALFRHAHAVLLTSTREGLPRSLVESLLVPVAAFSYPCEGVDDIFGKYRATFVSSNPTPDSLYRTIRHALERPVETSAAVRELHRKTLARFSPKAHLERLNELLCV
jgi:glycosyltransferase involved in cell wall biosynthesis